LTVAPPSNTVVAITDAHTTFFTTGTGFKWRE
jgi:hypothetical protein